MTDYAIHEETLTDVADVIRKKDGTSALIDPADYAERINLMGMLEEKTVSGSIVTFPDGADDVPLKKCEITLPASLDGYSEVDVVHYGKNLADFSSDTQDGEYHATVSYQNNGASISASGTYSRCAWTIPTIIGQTYTVSYSGVRDNEYGRVMFNNSATASGTMAYGVILLTSTETEYTKTFTATSDFLYLIIYNTGNTSAGTSTISNLMMEAGSTASTFEPYTAPTTHTASLGRTIYGGTVDVVKGTGESLCGKIVFDGSESRWSAYTTGNGYEIPLSGMKRGTWYTSDLALSYPLPKAPNNDNLGVRIGVNNDGIYVVQANTISGVTDLASFKAYLAENPLTVIYPLDDSEPFTFDPVPINSKLGNNTLWSEQGDTEVTYRGQGTAYIYPNAEEASF